MSLCEELLPLVSCRASGPLDPEDEALLATHLEDCAACRGLLAREEELLEELALPPASRELRAAVDRVADRTAIEWRNAERRRQRRSRLLGIWVAAAAVAAMVIAPAYLRDRAYSHSRPSAAVAESAPAAQAAGAETRGAPVQVASWEGPDLDEVWEASAVVGGSSVDEVAMTDEGTIFDSSSP